MKAKAFKPLPPLFYMLKPGNYKLYRYELKTRFEAYKPRTKSVKVYVGNVFIASTGGVTVSSTLCKRGLSKNDFLWTIHEAIRQ